MAATRKETERRPGATVKAGLGLAGRVALTWAVAGGVVAGGYLVALMTLTGRVSGSGVLLTSLGLFVVGAALGFVHGAALGVLGRPAGTTVREALAALGLGALYTLAALPVSYLAAGWIAMTLVALYLGKPLALAGVAVGWLAGAVLVAVGTAAGVRALRNAYARWPDALLGTLLVAASFGALLVTFLVDRPMIWLLPLRVTEVGAVLLALGVSLWVVGPAVTLALRLLRRMPAARPAPGLGGSRALSGLALGLAVGVTMGVLALPFHAPYEVPVASGTGPAGLLLLAFSRALVDEVLLRLVVVTGIAWLVLRWHEAHREEAALVGIVVAALVQVVLYVPGVLAIGFPTALAALAYTLAVVLVPALAFGAVYWARGLGAAVVADATAVAALAFLA